MEVLALTLDIMGKIMVAYTVLAVHNRVRKERKIDGGIFRAMKREQLIGVAGIISMIFGYVLHLNYKI